MRNVFLVLLLCALTGVSYGAANATAGGAGVRVDNYSLFPQVIYANSIGQLKLALSNSGSESAQSVTISMGGSTVAWVGNLGPGSSTITTIPFKVPADASGVYLLYLTIYYTDSGGVEVSQLTIPIEVSPEKALEVTTLSMDKQSIFPGESFTLELEFRNKGGSVSNVVLSSLSNSSFFITGTAYRNIGDIPSNSTKNVSLLLQSSSSASAGRQMVPLLLSYEDTLHNTVTETINVGPVAVLGTQALKVTLVPVSSVEIGSEAEFVLTVENRGSNVESAVIEIAPTSVFTPIGSSKMYFNQIQPGENKTQTVHLGVGATAAAGYYNLYLNITSSSGTASEVVGVSVQATPELTISEDVAAIPLGGEGKMAIKIANTGNSAIRSVYVTASSKDLQVTSSQSQFIGTLNVDDYFTYQPTVSAPARLSPGRYTVEIAVSFKDAMNQERTIRKEVSVQVGGAALQNAGSIGNRTRAGGGFRVFGVDVIPIVELIVVLAVLYFVAPRVYRKFKEYREGRRR